MIRYTFRDDGPVAIKNAAKADPQKIGEALASVARANAGHLTPKAVVEAARNARSPLHKLFEWDDAKAADSWRLEQAREIVRVVRVAEDDEEPMRAFLSISDKEGVSYRTAADVRNSADLQLAVLRQAERDLEAFERRYRDLKDLCEEVSSVRKRISARRQEAEARA